MGARLTATATTQGQAAARVQLPELPDDCRVKEARISPQVGEKWRGAYLRADGALRRANARVGRCADNYDNVRKRLGAAKGDGA